MEEIKNTFYNEVIYKERLENGLTIYLMPKKGYSQYSAIFMTNYGSFDTEYSFVGEENIIKSPEGVAHFLEHKMFEDVDGNDINDKFSSLGIEANAFTSYDRTAYTVSGTGNFKEAVELLLDFVQNPTFTTESINKERSIIEQELLMYLDSAKTVSRVRFLKALYGENDRIAKEIGGTVETIKEITKDVLLNCHETFYHPSNMVLVVVGGINVDELINLIRNNQSKKKFKNAKEIRRIRNDYSSNLDEIDSVSYFNLSTPIVTIGLKFPYVEEDDTISTKKAFALDFLIDANFGGFSSLSDDLRKSDLGEIDPIYSVTYYSGYGFFTVSATTKKVSEFTSFIKNKINKMLDSKISNEKLKTLERGVHTNNIKRFNSVQGLCNDLAELHFKGVDLFESIEIPNSITLEDIEIAKEILRNGVFATHTVYPNKKQ